MDRKNEASVGCIPLNPSIEFFYKSVLITTLITISDRMRSAEIDNGANENVIAQLLNASTITLVNLQKSFL